MPTSAAWLCCVCPKTLFSCADKGETLRERINPKPSQPPTRGRSVTSRRKRKGKMRDIRGPWLGAVTLKITQTPTPPARESAPHDAHGQGIRGRPFCRG